jgi:trans-aconitate 2-methyltransferase
MGGVWDPAVYLRQADHRARPFLDLLARVDEPDVSPRTSGKFGRVGTRSDFPDRGAAPPRIVDLGCGPGHLTALLAARWPDAHVLGLDSSLAMIAEADARLPEAPPGILGSLEFAVADIADYTPDPDTALIVANASLQWVPEHPELIRRWAVTLRDGGQLAFQVPGNHDAPSHQAIRDVAAQEDWAGTPLVTGPGPVLDPSGYAALLTDAGCHVDAWETTYLHRLSGTTSGIPHPVRRWLEGTTLRPVADALTPEDWDRFTAALDARLAAAYPVDNGQVWFPFRRVFVVARC